MEAAQQFLTDYGIVLGGALLLAVILWYALIPKKVPGEGQMKREEYEKQRVTLKGHRRKLNSLIADGVGDVLLNLYSKDSMTEEEYRLWNLRFSKILRDMVPRKLTQVQLKAAIRRRLKNPDKPLPKIKEEYKPKNAIDAILHRHYI